MNCLKFSTILFSLCFCIMTGTLFSAEVTSARGNATFTRYGMSPKPISKGSRLAVGDTVRTDERGQITILFKDETEVTVGPNSRYVITAEPAAKQPESTSSMLVSGTASYNLSKLSKLSKNEPYKVYTPTSIVGIRGTRFDAFADANGKTRLAVSEGVVAASADTVNDDAAMEGAAEIGAGEGFTADKGGSLKKGEVDIPKKRQVKKILAGKLKPDPEYVAYYTGVLKELGELIMELEKNHASLKSKKDALTAEAKKIESGGDMEAAKEKHKQAYDAGLQAFKAYRDLAHRILQYSGYLTLLENADLKDEEILELNQRIDQIAVEIKLKQ